MNRVLRNSAWLLVERAIKVLLGIVVGLLVARHLGPEEYGRYSYVYAVTAFYAVLCSLGLDGIIVRELSLRTRAVGAVLGSALALQALGAAIILLAILVLASIGILADNVLSVPWLWAAFVIPFLPAAVMRCYNEANTNSRLSVIAASISAIFVGILKLLAVLSGATLSIFVYLIILEFAVTSALLVSFYLKRSLGGKINLTVDSTVIKSLLKDGWPAFIAGICVFMSMKVDLLMIPFLSNERELGVYAAAATLSELWVFLPTIIVGSAFPTISRLSAASSMQGRKGWIALYSVVIWLAIVCTTLLFLFAEQVVLTLFGDDYASAVICLQIHAFSGISIAIGLVWSRWLLLENRLQVVLIAQVFSAFLNVLLNYLWIPDSGAAGAAWATLVSYSLSTAIAILLYRRGTTLEYLYESLKVYELGAHLHFIFRSRAPLSNASKQ
ncbi:flippase [Halioglobus pacificus]|uniref:flippase n=1 Tax=Parahalioglobus pacificus TaxID=930806 RepID=UPI0016729BC8|nr:flippase [Halioglobus pacificus]